uniref:CSON008964 protein n=1 Tax=Culicoides sonorensis TaxID=179676 RepID=A0A336MX90_CULSO
MAPITKKAQGRQTNNSLSSITEEHIVISPPTAVETSRKKKTVPSVKTPAEIFTETEEVLQIGMHKVLEHVKNHDDAWPFMDPVEEDIAPRYYSIIRRPMDLQRMEEKLDDGEYNTFSEFKNDFKLIVNNCRLYNGQNNEYTEMVNNLQIAFEKATRKYFDQNSSDEETFFDFLDVKHDAFHEKVLSEKIKNKKLLQLDIEDDDERVSKKRKNGDDKYYKDNPESYHKRKDEKKSSEFCRDIKGSDKKLNKEYDSSTSKLETSKIDYENFENCLTKKDKKKIIKEFKKKHKDKLKLAGKIKKERGRPKGSHKHKTEKIMESNISDVANETDNLSEDHYHTSVSSKKDKSEKKHKKDVYKLLKKEKERKYKHKSSSKKSKKHSIDAVMMSDISSTEFNDEDHYFSESVKKSSSKLDKKNDRERDDNDLHEQKMKKKSKKKIKKMVEENIEKRKPGRPKLKSSEESTSTSSKNHEHKKEKKKKQRDKNYDDEKIKNKSKECVIDEEPYYSAIEDSDHSSKNNLSFEDNSLERPLTPDIIDKYDLIKQRRRQKQNEDSRVKQTGEQKSSDKSAIKKPYKAEEVSLSKSSAKYECNKKKSNNNVEEKLQSSSSSKESKNHRLQETIEKLKKKSKKNKKENALLDEIFGVKPAKQINDEKSVYNKIRETYGTEKDTESNKKMTDVASKKPKNICEYDFIDELMVSKTGFEDKKSNKKPTPSEHTFISPSKKKEQAHSGKHLHKGVKGDKNHQAKTDKKQEKANMEALELETEQTLKDINKWLELTPHMSEFGSASSSPSRYIIDEFDTVAARTDDFMRPVPILQENQENHQNLNSQFDALKNDGKTGLQDHNTGNKQCSKSQHDQKHLKTNNKPDVKVRKTTKLLNYVPPRKREHQRTIDRLQPGKSKGNLLNAINVAKKLDSEDKPDIIATKVKEIKNSLIVETSEDGPKLSLGTVLDAEGFGLVQQHNFQDDKPIPDESDSKVEVDEDTDVSKQEETLSWAEAAKKDEVEIKEKATNSAEEDSDKTKKEEVKPNLSAWFKAFGIPKKQPIQSMKDNSCGDSLSQTLGVANSLPQPTMRQRKSSTGSTTSELSSVSQDPDSPRITIDESYTGSYKSPVQLPMVTSPKPDEFSPRQQSMSNYEINGPIKVGFYQDTTKCSPDKSPQEMANTTPQYSMAHRTPPNPSLTASLQNNFSYYTKNDLTRSLNTTNSLLDQCSKKPDHSNHDNSDYSSSPNNPNSPYQNQPMSPYLQNPHSPFTSQTHNQQGNESHIFTPNTQTNLPSNESQHIKAQENEKTCYNMANSDRAAVTSHSENQINNNESKRIQPPTYSSTPQYSLANLQKQTVEIPKTSVKDSTLSGSSSALNPSQYTTSGLCSTKNETLNTKSSTNEQSSTWPPQSLYGSNIDKNLFPLSLTNTHVSNDLTQNINQTNSTVLNQNQTQDLSNSQTYGQVPTYTGFDIRQKKSNDCIASSQTSTIANDPVSLVAKNQEIQRKQHSSITSDIYDNKSPIDYANPNSERYKSNEAYSATSYGKNLLGDTQSNKNTTGSISFDTQNRQQPKPNLPLSTMSKHFSDHLQQDHLQQQQQQQQNHQQQSMYGNNRGPNYLGTDPVDLKASMSSSTSIPHSNHPKSIEGSSQGINLYGNNYMSHGQQSQNPSTDYAMGGTSLQNPRYTDISRQPPGSHNQTQMDAYKNSAYIRNFASMMAEMGLPASAQNPYSQSMAHQFAKTFHQVTTAALQQFLPSSSMTTTAYSKSSREDDTRSAASKSFSSLSQQTSSSSVISQYLGSNTNNSGTREASHLTSQQQQHLAAYQQKFTEAANMPQNSDLNQSHQMDIKQTSSRKSSKSSVKKGKQNSQASALPSQQEMLINPGMHQASSGSYTSQSIPATHNFPPYASSNISTKLADNSSNSGTKTASNAASGVAGSAFNFTPTPSLSLPGPPGLYPDTQNYLDDFRGATNPYYSIPAPTGHRNSADLTATEKTNPAANNTSTVSSPYHQFLPHPSARSGYPFMPPASFDPLQQQWNLQREEQLRAQMMLASNPYSQSGYPRHLWG